MVLPLEFTRERLGSDFIARELAYFCAIDPGEYLQKCEELSGRERRRCKNRVSFSIYCIRRTDLVIELPSNVLIFIPCVLTLVHRYGSTRVAKEKISELLLKSGKRVYLSTEDIKSVKRWVKKSPIYLVLNEYAEKVALSCHLSSEALKLIETLNSILHCRAISKLLLSYVIIALNTMSLQKTLKSLDSLIIYPAHVCLNIFENHVFQDLNKPSESFDVNILIAISNILHKLVNSLLEAHALARHLTKALERQVYSKYIDTTPSRQRFAKYMASKLLQYNSLMRICVELSEATVDTLGIKYT